LSLATIPAVAVLLTAAALQASPPGITPGKPAAEVNGQPITDQKIDKAIAGPLAKLQEHIYNLRQQRIETTIRDRLLAQEAARRGLSVQKRIDAEPTSKVGLVTEEEVERFYQANRSSADDLKAYAREVGLDLARFDRCLARGKHKELVQKDIDEGARLGVNGTPAFFINGELLSGAQPLENFVRLVDRELAQAR
jgi:hypothetical protein